jgi:uncharacterized membrane protein
MIKKEILIYIVILVVAAIGMHPDLISDPAQRFSQMQSMGNYTHPFIYSFILYLIIGIFRVIIGFIKKLFTSKQSDEEKITKED